MPEDQKLADEPQYVITACPLCHAAGKAAALYLDEDPAYCSCEAHGRMTMASLWEIAGHG